MIKKNKELGRMDQKASKKDSVWMGVYVDPNVTDRRNWQGNSQH
jgi:hypothetical protein